MDAADCRGSDIHVMYGTKRWMSVQNAERHRPPIERAGGNLCREFGRIGLVWILHYRLE